MMSSLYIGATGIKTHDSGMATVSNNIANVNTVGFKQSNWLFQDLFYSQLALGTSSTTVENQLGHGSVHYDNRTLFTQGNYEATENFTDLSINGKGFFQVIDPNGDEFLTRAGNFIFDNEGYYTDHTGAIVQAYAIDPLTGVEGALGDMQLDIVNDAPISPAVATSSLTAQFNIGISNSQFENYERVTIADPNSPTGTTEVDQVVNPYFSMISAYNSQNEPTLANAAYTQPLTIYDSSGNQQDLLVTFDIASDENGQKIVEYLISVDPESVEYNGSNPDKAGMLMSGTMTYSSSGQLIDMSAFTPTVGSDYSDLSNWKPSALSENGFPVLDVTFLDGEAQSIELNFGAKGTAWSDPNITAADINTDSTLLPSIAVPPDLESTASTAYAGASNVKNLNQDGNAQGELSNIQVKSDGTVYGIFNNGESHPLYRIPVFRVTSEDGLRNDGNNHYIVTDQCGLLEEGVAGTSNYGTISSHALEGSNVDMANEMVSLIVLQRGFQSNSKAVTTADEMLQKAITLKAS